MFISEEESKRRLEDPRNVLHRVSRGETISTPEIPDAILPIIDSIEKPKDLIEETIAEAADEAAEIVDESEPLDPTQLLEMNRIINTGRRTPGRKLGIRNKSIQENASIAITSNILGAGPTTEMFGTDPAVQGLLKRGYTGSGDKAAGRDPKTDLLNEIYDQGAQVSRRAFKHIHTALGLIDSDAGPKIAEVKDIGKMVGIAKNLSGIIKDMTPKDGNLNEGGVHFHIYAPEQNDEEHYETLEVATDGSVSVSQ